jgi:hypothetical protein
MSCVCLCVSCVVCAMQASSRRRRQPLYARTLLTPSPQMPAQAAIAAGVSSLALAAAPHAQAANEAMMVAEVSGPHEVN